MTARRLRAPAIDGGVLVEPPAAAVAGQIAANSRSVSSTGTTIFRDEGRSCAASGRSATKSSRRRGDFSSGTACRHRQSTLRTLAGIRIVP